MAASTRAQESKASEDGRGERSTASGDEGGERPADDEPEEPPPPREVPDYDGRPPARPGPRQRLLWIPRVLFYPAYLSVDYLVRRPLGLAVTAAEKHEVLQDLREFFTFGKDDRGLWLPTLLVDFSLQPSVGALVRVDDVGVEGHTVQVQFATWGPDWLGGWVTESYAPPAKRWQLHGDVRASRRPDGLFFGIGGDIESQLESRYQRTDVQARLRFDLDSLWRQSDVEAFQRLRYMDFGNDVCCGGPSIAERVEQGAYPSPPAFEEGYLALGHGLRLVLDSRRARPAPGTGVRLALRGAHHFDPRAPRRLQWLEYGGQAGVFVDVTGHNHVVDLTLVADLVQALHGDVPFTELVSMSGAGPLAGFVSRRLIGSSGGALVAEYRWPIWLWLDGSLHFGVGNVFDGRFQGLTPEALRMSWGVGVRSSRERGGKFSMLVAFGSETLEEGAKVESFRFLFGSTGGF